MALTLLVITVLILANALYVAAEFAAVSVRRSRIRQHAEQGNRFARQLLPVLADARALDRYVAACQIGITVSSLVLGAFGQATLGFSLAPLLERWTGMGPVGAQSASALVVLAFLTVSQMILGELVPKSLALQKPTQTALWTVVPMRWSLVLFSGAIRVLNGSGAAVLRLFGVDPVGHRHIHSPEEIDLLIAESRDGGLLEPDEQRRLRRALQLGIRPARHLMIPRPQIASIDIGTAMPEVVRAVSESPYTRLPVYRGTIDNVVGMLHTRDLFTRYLEGRPTTVEELLRPILIVHESVTADRLLTLMRERRSHQAIVADEFGGVAGLVTLEDVLTEVMGDVADEFKTDEPRPERLPDGRVRLPGFLRVDEAEPWIGVYLDGEADTIGGRVVEELGHLPEPGDTVVVDGVELEVEKVASHAVASVLATPADTGEVKPEEEG